MRRTEIGVVWAVIAFLGICVMVGLLLIYHLFTVEHQDRQAQNAQTTRDLAAQHATICAAIGAIPLPVDDAPFLRELERRSGCPLTTPRPLPTPTTTVVVPGRTVVVMPGGAHTPGVMAAPTPTVKRPAGTGTAPQRPFVPTRPAPTPSPSPSPRCVLGLLCLP